MGEREPLAAEPSGGGEGSGDLVREIRIAAPPETVFPFFTDPRQYVRWKGRSAELEPEPGGVYRVDIDGNVVAGEFVEVDPPRRVVFTWGWEGGPMAPGSTTVEVDLEPDGEGTLVRLTHRGLPDETKPEHGAGWDHFLPRLATVAAGGDPGPDPWTAVDGS
ncbi:MAG TPA: SRPBCC domain-containing protein, partial [Actinomycetota bacterium]|nr:SRPBCC domain-containing protein [Actinomycetota bacterium]